MPDRLEPAASGRAACRGCGRKIAKGELRFGEALPNAFGEGEATHWFDLVCAACKRPEKLLAVVEATSDAVPDREWLVQTARVGAAHRRLPRLERAERAPSGRARCRSCRELIDAGAWRLVLAMFDDGRKVPIGNVHAECAEAYLGTADVLDRVARLTPDLSEGDRAEIAEALAVRRAPAQEGSSD